MRAGAFHHSLQVELGVQLDGVSMYAVGCRATVESRLSICGPITANQRATCAAGGKVGAWVATEATSSLLETRPLLSPRSIHLLLALHHGGVYDNETRPDTNLAWGICLQQSTTASDWGCSARGEGCVPMTSDGSLTVTLFSLACPSFVTVRVYLARRKRWGSHDR